MGIPGAANPLLLRRAAAADDDAYQIPKSLRFNDDDTAYLHRGVSTDGNRRTWTYAAWIKHHAKPSGDAINVKWLTASDTSQMQIKNDGTLLINWDGNTHKLQTNRVLRDPAGWFHLVIVSDTLNLVDSDRLRVYINGKRETSFSTALYPDQNDVADWLKANENLWIGRAHDEAQYGDGYLADVHLIDGLALSPAAFGSFDKGIWNPKAFAIPKPNDGTTWSSTVTTGGASLYDTAFSPGSGKATNLFNSDGIEYGTWAGASSGVDNATGICTWKPPSDITANCSIRIGFIKIKYTAKGTFTINGEDLLTDMFTQTGVGMGGTNGVSKWYTAPSKTITAADGITWAKYDNNNAVVPSVIEVDGVILRDGITDVETRNNLNDGRTWSSYWSATTGTVDGSNGFTNSFDGSVATRTNASNNSILKWIPPTTITAEKSIELYMYLKGSLQGENDFKVNNVSKWNDAHGTLGDYQVGWYDIGKTIDATNGIQIGQDTSNDYTCFFYAMRVDGHVLIDGAVDNSFHLKFDDTSRNSALGKDSLNGKIDDATGGLPFYETTDDYGETKASSGTLYRSDSTAGTTDGAGLIFAMPGDVLTDEHDHVNTGSSAHTVTNNGSNVSVTTKESRLYGSSLDFGDSGSADTYLTLPEHADFQFGTGDFCIEMWVYYQKTTRETYSLWGQKNNPEDGVMFRIDGYGEVLKAFFTWAGGGELSCNYNFNNKWTHVALTRASGTFKLWVNGVEKASNTASYDMDGSVAPRIGSNVPNGSTEYFAGKLQDIRVYKGNAKYTSNFTVPNRNDFTPVNLNHDDQGVLISASTGAKPIWTTNDSPNYGDSIPASPSLASDSIAGNLVSCLPLTTAGSNAFTDDESPTGRTNVAVSWSSSGTISSTADAVFYGSAASFSTGAYMSCNDSDLTFGSGTFTLEFWVKNGGANTCLFNTSTSTNGNVYQFHSRLWGASSTGTLDVYGAAGSEYIGISMADHGCAVGVWRHIAFVKDGSTMRVYSNGKKVAENSNWSSTNANFTGSTWYINNGNAGISAQAACSYQDVRFYNVAKYSADFVVPISPLPEEIDSFVDSPTNYAPDTGDDADGGVTRGNYCTWNPLSNYAGATLSNGNLDVTASAEQFRAVVGTMFPTTGKWYFEVTIVDRSGDQNVGIAADTFIPSGSDNRYVGRTSDSWGFYSDGRKIHNNTFTSYGSSWAVGDVLGIAYDLDAGKMWFAINNTWQVSGNPATGANETFSGITGAVGPACAPYGASGNRGTFHLNTGQKAFKYTAPSGFKCLCTQNLDDLFSGAALNDPSKYFDVKIWTGTGASKNIKDVGFQPDLVWIKSRSDADDHCLFDANRGVTKRLTSNGNNIESTEAQELTAFNSDGFTVGTDDAVNESGDAFVAWMWDVGTTGAANNDGSINVTNQWVNATAGISITKFEGTGANATIGHGLGVPPELIIIKNVDSTQPWIVGNNYYHATTPWGYYTHLNTDDAAAALSLAWQDTAPTSTVFSIGATGALNTDDEDNIAYCWAPIKGFSAFGSYEGSGNSETGQFIYTGFKPKFLLVKRYDNSAGAYWGIVDSERSPFNKANDFLYADTNGAEADEGNYHAFDLLSNGFRPTGSYPTTNTSGGLYSYCAFAEHPLKTSRAG